MGSCSVQGISPQSFFNVVKYKFARNIHLSAIKKKNICCLHKLNDGSQQSFTISRENSLAMCNLPYKVNSLFFFNKSTH